jgi:hypothetical protein
VPSTLRDQRPALLAERRQVGNLDEAIVRRHVRGVHVARI